MTVSDAIALSAADGDLACQALSALFEGCGREQIDAVVAQACCRQLPAGAVLLQLEERADAAYVLLAGQLQVYGRQGSAQLVPIAHLDHPGRLLGEQALLPGHRFRNAYVLALASSRVLEIPAAAFQQLLDADASALQRLQEQAVGELRQRLQRLGLDLDELWEDRDEQRSLQFEPGSTVLTAGETPTTVFAIVSGQVALWAGAQPEAVMVLGQGSVLGLEAVLSNRPFGYDARAETRLELLPLRSERLRMRLGDTPLLDSLQAMHQLPGVGLMYRYRTTHEGHVCFVTDYEQLPGGPVRVLQIPAQQRVEATRVAPAAIEPSVWMSPDGRNQLLVHPQDGHLVAFAVDQSWPSLGELMALLLRHTPMHALQLEAFVRSGALLVEAADQRVSLDTQLICACSNTTATELRAVASSCESLADLQRCTGAGMVCGACLARLPLFLDQPDGVRLCQLSSSPLSEGVAAVQLRPLEGTLPPWRVGQHVALETLIDGRWVGRSYTLVDAAPDRYELGVKREPGGVFSNWLLDAGPEALVRVSAPAGEVVPDPKDGRLLLYLVAGIGVTPAMAAVQGLRGARPITVAYTFRGAAGAYLDDLRAAAAAGRITLIEHDSARAGRLEPQSWLGQLECFSDQEVEVIVCGPEAFNGDWQLRLQQQRPRWQVRLESFAGSSTAALRAGEPGAWRLPPEELAARHAQQQAQLGPAPEPIAVGACAPAAEARAFLQWFQRERRPDLDLEARCGLALQHLAERDCWPLSREELGFGAQLAWRQAERCVGRRYWQGLDLRDHRELRRAADIAEALFDHLRFAYNGGDLRPAISVFDPGERGRPGPRIWNPQLLRYAGYRTSTGRQVGDPAQNALTARLMQLGWRPSGGDFELLPLVIETAAEGPCLFELPPDCRHEVRIRHGRHPWLEQLALRWYAVPAVSDMALDLAGVLFRLAPFNGWYLDTEIAARNFSDINRFNLLPRVAEGLGLDLHDERSLWRDRAQLVLAEAVLQSFDQAGVKISDHHTIGHEFLDFCRQEQQLGREPEAEWSWMVPPMAGSLSVLYQEPFSNRALKPAYVAQDPVWQPSAVAEPARRCPFSG